MSNDMNKNDTAGESTHVVINDISYDVTKTNLYINAPHTHVGRQSTIDITPVSAMTHLTSVIFDHCKLEGTESLAALPNLKSIILGGVRDSIIHIPASVEYFSAEKCRGLSFAIPEDAKLSTICMEGSLITDLSPFMKAPELESLHLAKTPISSALNAAFGLARIGKFLSREWKRCHDGMEEQVSTLQDRGVKVTFKPSTVEYY